MRIVDFDIGLSPGSFPEPREVNLRYRAFVEAVVTELRATRPEAPWRKFYVSFTDQGQEPTWMPALPNVGLSSAGVHVGIQDPALLTIRGEAIRSHLAEAIVGLRSFVSAESGWDDPRFWELVERIGSNRGPYHRAISLATDRKTAVSYCLLYEFDEAGTRQVVEAFRASARDVSLGRTVINDFPGQWDWFDGRVPQKVRLTPDGIEVRDRAGVLLRIQRPG